MVTARTAAATATATLDARRTQARAALKAYVDAVKVKLPAARTPEERAISALAWLVGHDPD
jgi:hypothetical protein